MGTIVMAIAPASPVGLRLEPSVLKQNFNTDDMGHKIPRCIEWITSVHDVEPEREAKGLTGTTPQLTGKYAKADTGGGVAAR